MKGQKENKGKVDGWNSSEEERIETGEPQAEGGLKSEINKGSKRRLGTAAKEQKPQNKPKRTSKSVQREQAVKENHVERGKNIRRARLGEDREGTGLSHHSV